MNEEEARSEKVKNLIQDLMAWKLRQVECAEAVPQNEEARLNNYAGEHDAWSRVEYLLEEVRKA